MAIHLGKNPINGGIPPNDKKLIMNENFIVDLLLRELFN